MNPIEQLGGYEAAKKKYGERPHAFVWGDIGKALLSYRRVHGIFDVGDYAIDEQHTGLLRVTRVLKKRLDADYLNPQTLGFICHHSILIRHIRHATDEEIKAGRRL